jgi:hypothetical protein
MFAKIAVLAAVALTAEARWVTSYKMFHRRGGIGGNDLKCGFRSARAIQNYCNRHSRCKGFSYLHGRGWWCAKYRGSPGHYNRTHNWF